MSLSLDTYEFSTYLQDFHEPPQARVLLVCLVSTKNCQELLIREQGAM
jgi:hypothetical protein